MRTGALLLATFCWLALAGGGFAQSVGVAAAVNQSARGTPPTAKPRTLTLGDKVIHNERIETNGVGLLQILLADGTSFTVGPNSDMRIDSFVYDPDAGTAKVVATLGKGVFRFIGGKTSKSPDGAVLNTPVGTVGIRGGISDLDFSGHGQTPFHIDMLFGQSIVLTGPNGAMLGKLYHAGYSIVIGADGKPAIIKTPPSWTQSFQASLSSHGSQNGGTGKSQSANGTAVADALGAGGGANPPNPPSGGTGTPPGTMLADTGTPPVPFTPPSSGEPTSTWAEINNSDLANVYATYGGPASATITATAGQDQYAYDWSGQFALDYYFGSHNGQGVFSLSDPDDGEIIGGIPVTPDQPAGTGPATFGAHYNNFVPCDCGDVTVNLDVNGHFINSGGGIANKVGGTFNFGATGSYFDTNDTQVPASESVVGTFGGDRTGTSSSPPSNWPNQYNY
jgi:hypothetical protein